MTDKLTASQRSRNMRAIRARDTKPELAIRQLLHMLGYRFTLHAPGLPGKPDIVFSAKRKAVLVHGCFWHGHDCRVGNRSPRSNQSYWGPKIAGNVTRDAQSGEALKALGWQALTVWECDIKALRDNPDRLTTFLGPPRTSPSGGIGGKG